GLRLSWGRGIGGAFPRGGTRAGGAGRASSVGLYGAPKSPKEKGTQTILFPRRFFFLPPLPSPPPSSSPLLVAPWSPSLPLVVRCAKDLTTARWLNGNSS